MAWFIGLLLLFMLFMSGAVIYVASAPLWDESFVRVPDALSWGVTGFAVIFVVILWIGVIRTIRDF